MPNAALTLRLSPEETARFGIICGRADHVDAADLDEVLAFCGRERVRLLTLRCDVQSIDTAQRVEQAGFLLMDTLVYTARDVARPLSEPSAASVQIAMAAASDVHEIGDLSRAAFASYVSHYHADPLLPKTAAADVYREWAERRCGNASVEEPFLIARDERGIVGFAGLRVAGSQDVDCELCAVAPRAQGQGVFRALIGAGIAWAAAHGRARLTYSTQIQNTAALRGLTSMGFHYERASYTFHKWFQPDA